MPHVRDDDVSGGRHPEMHHEPGHGKLTPLILIDAVGHSPRPGKVAQKAGGSDERLKQSLRGLCSRLLSPLIDDGCKLPSS